MISCANCQFPNPDEARYCGACGAPLAAAVGPARCPGCGTSVDPGAKFCETCGRQLGRANYAGFWSRFGAWFLDSFIGGIIAAIPAVAIGFLTYALAGPAESGDLAPGETDPAETAGFIAGYTVYFVLLSAYLWLGNAYGGTFGKRIFGLRVVLESNGEEIGLGRSFVRLIVYYVGYAIFYLGLLWMIWDKKKQTWHDKSAGSIVIKN
jgi:uncharacterized RDD family membrane protein YckC